MTYKKISFLSSCIYIGLIFAILVQTGCCGRKKPINKSKKNYNFSESLKKSNKKVAKKIVKDNTNEFDDIDIDLSGSIPLRQKDELTSKLYERFSYANDMYKSRDYDGAIREISIIQQEAKNDPYLRMQTWALLAMIYDKTGKNSRRKRSYSKMIETMAEVQKDARYKKAYEDGMICQELIASATQKGDKKYDF